MAARHLHNAGVRVLVCHAAAPSPRGGDAAVYRAIVEKMGLPCRDILDAAQLAAAAAELEKADVFVDALLGTGFHGEIQAASGGHHPALNALANEKREGRRGGRAVGNGLRHRRRRRPRRSARI